MGATVRAAAPQAACSVPPAASTRSATSAAPGLSGATTRCSVSRPSCRHTLNHRSSSRRAGRHSVRVTAWQPPAGATNASDAEDTDYYAILGLSYTASTDEIKRAYRRLAKEFHPDVSADESNTEFAIFLNDVYDTLSDPEKRAAYDSIVGFQVGGINPFRDTSYERDSVFVDEFTCIGCRNCHNVACSTFEMEDEWGRARVRQQGVDGVEKLQEAIDCCPVTCIHWVTAPQLALLEETMSRMERVAAFLLLTGGGKGANLNVFVEASLAWEKRQSALQAKAQADTRWSFFKGGAAAGSKMQNGAQEADAYARTNATLGRGVNAATVAAAARRWRDYQRTKRQKETRLLSTNSSVSLDSADEAAVV
ncbi:Chaperone protein dnaJ C76 [Chlorella vulgaris]